MSESGAGETKVDGKAHEEGDEICRSPGKRAESAGGGEVGQQRRGVFRKGCGIVAQSLELLLLGGLQRSEGAGVSVADGTEERVSRGLKGGPTGGMHLLDRAQFQGPFLVGLAPAPPFSPGNQSKTSAADAEGEDEHNGQSIQKREDLFYDLVLFLSEPRM